MKKIKMAVIGATGSVGASVLDICARFPEIFDVYALAAKSNAKKLAELGRKHGAKILCLTEPNDENWKEEGFVCISGENCLCELADDAAIEHIAFASSGTAAIKALQHALMRGADVSLANKESIVVAGPWVMPLVKREHQLRPVDSEHSAVWQCMREARHNEISRIWLTASGGPFRNYSKEELKKVKPCDALKHPVWQMGAKITIDSATLMNKGIECIEAMRLFNLTGDRVGALINHCSHIHGLCEFIDGTVKLLLSQPDMRLPAAAAIAYPNRLPLIERGLPPLAPETWNLTFNMIDTERFPSFKIACEAGRAGGAYPSLLVGADEIAVDSFIKEKISFMEIPLIVENVLASYKGVAPSTLEEAEMLVDEGRKAAEELCYTRRHSF